MHKFIYLHVHIYAMCIFLHMCLCVCKGERERERSILDRLDILLRGKCPEKIEPAGTIPIISQSKNRYRKARQ